MVTASEKDDALANLWMQYTEEMLLLEGNVSNIQGIKNITMEFQPSADQAWQFWANNELTQAATYPSMFAKVHKSQLKLMNGTIGLSKDDTWAAPTAKSRREDLESLNSYRKTLNLTLTAETIHKKELQFMAENGLRQIGEPRIGPYANLQRPESLHLEVCIYYHSIFTVILLASMSNLI